MRREICCRGALLGPYTSAGVTLIAPCPYHQRQLVTFDGGSSQLKQHLTKSVMMFHKLP